MKTQTEHEEAEWERADAFCEQYELPGLTKELAKLLAEHRRDTIAAVVACLETLPWKGPGSLHVGEIAERLRAESKT